MRPNKNSFLNVTCVLTFSGLVLGSAEFSRAEGLTCSSVFTQDLAVTPAKEAKLPRIEAPYISTLNFKEKLNVYSSARHQLSSSALDILIDPKDSRIVALSQKIAQSDKVTAQVITEAIAASLPTKEKSIWLSKLIKKFKTAREQKIKNTDLFDLEASPDKRPLYSALLTKTLLDNLTSRKNSLVVLKGTLKGQPIELDAVAIKGGETDAQIVIPSLTHKVFNLNSEGQVQLEIQGQMILLEVSASPWKLEPLDTVKTAKSTDFTLMASNGRLLKMNLQGRSAFERKMKQEAELIQNASSDNEVPVEWYFHPHYAPLGHTTIRIGDVLYNFTTKGWDIHGEGASNPRAFLFNNPFFKNQYERFKDQGMPPFTLGVTLKIQKSAIEKFIASVHSEKTQEFSLFFNNCNQCVIRNFSETPLAQLDAKTYQAFSSAMSFRELILEAPVKMDDVISLYPVTSLDSLNLNLRELIPARLYKSNTTLKEIIHNIRNWKAPRSTDPLEPVTPDAESVASNEK